MEIEYIRHPFKDSSQYKVEPCVLALGFFDGVHTGHQKILQHAKEIAEQKQLIFGVMTFFPHPKEIFNPAQAPMTYLSPLSLKEEQFRSLGVEKLYVVQFTAEFSQLSPEDFVKDYLIGLNCKHVVAGFDYHYGHKGNGSMKTLKQHGLGYFDVTTIGEITYGEQKISSTAIRQLLAIGDVQSIPSYLGRHYEVHGKVERASLFYSSDQFISIRVEEAFRLPTNGMYDIMVELDGEQFKGKCLQMRSRNDQLFILIRLSTCFTNMSQKRVTIRWISFVMSELDDSRDMETYFIQNEDPITIEDSFYNKYVIV
ncbi:adenylyltransferase/cytidyltransferase family protein [Bacillus massiliigorillae]|uniref:adenylyltransferase/cytidyltransferase family protein n=1 Tax=Bacillus massiliigorillae TaxID=1243664 RepID=UPI00039E66FE|nr:adenylyltransferase/cytidyltransferase family protein [Bacillus massiliigorillae]